MYDIDVVIHPEGGSTLASPEFAYEAWRELHLCHQVMDFPRWWEYQQELFSMGFNAEIGIYHGSQLIGLAILTEVTDSHVGPHMSIFLQYVLPEHRNQTKLWKQVFNLSKQITKDMNYQYLSWTHMKTHNKCMVTYRDLRQ